MQDVAFFSKKEKRKKKKEKRKKKNEKQDVAIRLLVVWT